MTQWLSIDTAPKNGARLLLLVANSDSENARVFARWKDGAWRDDRHIPLREAPVGWWPSADRSPPEHGDALSARD